MCVINVLISTLLTVEEIDCTEEGSLYPDCTAPHIFASFIYSKLWKCVYISFPAKLTQHFTYFAITDDEIGLI